LRQPDRGCFGRVLVRWLPTGHRGAGGTAGSAGDPVRRGGSTGSVAWVWARPAPAACPCGGRVPGARGGGVPGVGERAAAGRVGGCAAEEQLAGGGRVAGDVEGEGDRGVGRGGGELDPLDGAVVGEAERQGLAGDPRVVTGAQVHAGEVAEIPGVE